MKFYENKKKFLEIIGKFTGKKIAVLGDLMVDRFIKGKVRRISPEAPVPVIEVVTETSTFGGAGNVANNILSLGGKPFVISIIGDDRWGRELLEMFKSKNMNTEGILVHKNQRTIEKIRVIAEHQQVARIDREVKFRYEGKLINKILENLKFFIREGVSALILSDYGKGILAPFIIRQAIKLFNNNGLPVFVDPKIEHFKLYKRVTSITPNVMEAFSGMHMSEKNSQDEIEKLGLKIVKTLKLNSLIITQSENGLTVFKNENGKMKIKHIPAMAKEVYDVTGAGDTVISCLALAYTVCRDIFISAAIANFAAGIVVGKLGTAVTNQEELKREIELWIKQ